MDKEILMEKNHGVIRYLLMVLAIFLAILAVSEFVSIQNKIKEGHYIGADFEARNTITVSDFAEIYAKPNLAIISFSVVSEAKTVGEATKKNTEAMNAVINAIKDKGVDSKDLKTTNYGLYPKYEWVKGQEESLYYPQGRQVLIGYEVNQSVQVKIRELDKSGEIIEAATVAGANQVGSLQFTIEKEDELKSQARAEAIKKAKDKAKELAKQLGVSLERVVSFTEGNVPVYYDYAYKEAAPIGMGGGEGISPQIETGENVIRATVSITYEIR